MWCGYFWWGMLPYQGLDISLYCWQIAHSAEAAMVRESSCSLCRQSLCPCHHSYIVHTLLCKYWGTWRGILPNSWLSVPPSGGHSRVGIMWAQGGTLSVLHTKVYLHDSSPSLYISNLSILNFPGLRPINQAFHPFPTAHKHHFLVHFSFFIIIYHYFCL